MIKENDVMSRRLCFCRAHYDRILSSYLYILFFVSFFLVQRDDSCPPIPECDTKSDDSCPPIPECDTKSGGSTVCVSFSDTPTSASKLGGGLPSPSASVAR